MKTCIACGHSKPVEEFSLVKKGGDRRHGRCDDCKRAYGQHHYKNNKRLYVERNKRQRQRQRQRQREKLEKLKDRPCLDCGKKYHTWVMEFDHREGETKIGNISKLFLASRISKECLFEEISKCDVVCANCHRMRTYARHMRKNAAVV